MDNGHMGSESHFDRQLITIYDREQHPLLKDFSVLVFLYIAEMKFSQSCA